MRKRKIGHSDLFVSEIGLGCMSVGTEEKAALKLIDAAMEHGINFLDTADLYDKGLNEAFVGKVLKGRRDKIIVATKVGNRWEEGASGWSWDPSKKHIKEAVKGSLQRLQTDYIDLYQLHGGTIEDNIDETIEAFEELKKEGIIRYYGISSIRPNVIREYVKRSSIVSVMMQYSILDRRPESVFPLLQENGVSVLARGPLAKGLLTDRSLDVSTKVKEDGYLSYTLEEIKNLRTQLTNELNRPLTEIALQYCLHSPVVASIVAGASKAEQIQQNIQAASASRLLDDEWQMIQESSKAVKYEQHQ